MSHHFSVAPFFFLALLLLCGTRISPAGAACHLEEGEANGIVTFQVPSVIILDPDTPVGTVVYEHNVESGEVVVKCEGRDEQIRKGYLTLNNGDAREDVLPGVYRTNVPGIGIRAAASTERLPTYSDDDFIRPWDYYGMRHGSSSDTVTFRAAAQFVVIGSIEEGNLDTSLLTAQETLGGSVLGEMRFSPTTVRITTNTCNLIDKNIYVPLKTINAHDLKDGYSEILTDSGFKIEITDCRAGTRVDYRFKSAGSMGVKTSNILDIASGDQAASGVGIQILDGNNTVIGFDQDYTAISSTRENEKVEIPLKARYIKTGDVKAGKVDAVATFDVFYR